VEHRDVAPRSRLRAGAGSEPAIVPAGKTPGEARAALIFETALGMCEGFSSARYNSAKAVLLGRSYQFIAGERRLCALWDGGPKLNWWIPTGFEDVDRRRFQFVPIRPGEPGAPATGYGSRLQMFSLGNSSWLDIDPAFFIRAIYDETEGRLGYGNGILGAVYFHHYSQAVVLREGLQGIERWAQGLTVAKVKGSRLGSPGKNNDAQRRKWLATLEKMRARNSLVMEEGDDVSVIFPSGTGGQIVMDMLHYIDDITRARINGSVLPLGGGQEVGSNARSETEQDESDMMVRFDRKQLDECWTRDLVGAFWRNNRALLYACGLGDVRPPKFKTVISEEESPSQFLAQAKTVIECGAEIVSEEFYRRAGLKMPPNCPPTIGKAAMQQATSGLPLTDPNGMLKDPAQRAAVAAIGAEAGATENANADEKKEEAVAVAE
jgi:hypothetical protein